MRRASTLAAVTIDRHDPDVDPTDIAALTDIDAIVERRQRQLGLPTGEAAGAVPDTVAARLRIERVAKVSTALHRLGLRQRAWRDLPTAASLRSVTGIPVPLVKAALAELVNLGVVEVRPWPTSPSKRQGRLHPRPLMVEGGDE